jgi:hypothetical protein
LHSSAVRRKKLAEARFVSEPVGQESAPFDVKQSSCASLVPQHSAYRAGRVIGIQRAQYVRNDGVTVAFEGLDNLRCGYLHFVTEIGFGKPL